MLFCQFIIIITFIINLIIIRLSSVANVESLFVKFWFFLLDHPFLLYFVICIRAPGPPLVIM